MRLIVAAIGRLKAGPERELAERYRARVAKAGRAVGLRDIEIIEIRESRAQETSRRVLEESIALANIIPERAVIVALDERDREASQRRIVRDRQPIDPAADDNRLVVRAIHEARLLARWGRGCASDSDPQPEHR